MSGIGITGTKGDFAYAIKGAAIAAGLAVMSFATQASALTEVKLTNAAMDMTYRAYINGSETISNGITFTVDPVAPGANYDVFAFCVDIFHHISLGPINLTYLSNKGDPGEPLTTNFGTPVPTPLDAYQKAHVSALVDIGFLLNRDSPGAATSLQTAAIQAAIWKTLNPTVNITLRTNNLGGAQATNYTNAYNYYLTTDFGPVDRIYTLVPKSPGDTQRFAVGWPIEVPEPATWGLMLVGFFATGGMLRSRRVRLALAH